MSVACPHLSFRLFSSCHGFSNERLLDSGLQRFGKESDGVTLHLKLHSITPVATKVHVILRGFVVLTWMRDAVELV